MLVKMDTFVKPILDLTCCLFLYNTGATELDRNDWDKKTDVKDWFEREMCYKKRRISINESHYKTKCVNATVDKLLRNRKIKLPWAAVYRGNDPTNKANQRLCLCLPGLYQYAKGNTSQEIYDQLLAEGHTMNHNHKDELPEVDNKKCANLFEGVRMQKEMNTAGWNQQTYDEFANNIIKRPVIEMIYTLMVENDGCYECLNKDNVTTHLAVGNSVSLAVPDEILHCFRGLSENKREDARPERTRRIAPTRDVVPAVPRKTLDVTHDILLEVAKHLGLCRNCISVSKASVSRDKQTSSISIVFCETCLQKNDPRQ